MQHRHFFHSFPRPKAEESEDATLERGLNILRFMRACGLVLAPEIVDWNVSFSGAAEQLQILQQRACFTELSTAELPRHSAMFGPIALAFDLAKLRSVGAIPVIYIPQGDEISALSQIGTFCVNGAYHTQYVLNQFQRLKEQSDPGLLAGQLGRPVAPNYTLNLQNSDPAGNIVAEYSIPASNVRDVLQHVGFNSIPFDHSIGVLNVFLNMFYPTDNNHTGDELGYYRQREWRLIAGNIQINRRQICRSLSESEAAKLLEIDPKFWTRELMVNGVSHQRSDLALLYEPMRDWNFLELVEAIFVPESAIERVRAIVGDKIAVRPQP